MQKREPPKLTPEESAAIEQFIKDLLGDTICPQCKTPLTGQRQVGRSVYGEPCGCRMYQGEVTPKWRKPGWRRPWELDM